MLKKYYPYLNEEASGIEHLAKPDPAGAAAARSDVANYRPTYTKMMTDALSGIKKGVTEKIVEDLKEKLMGRTVIITNESGNPKIIRVEDIVVGNTGEDYYPVLVQESKKVKSRYVYETDSKSKIVFIDTFLKFFEKNYLNEVIKFTGKTSRGQEGTFTRQIIRIGIQRGTRDQIMVQDNEDKKYEIYFNNPIKIYDKKLLELDPYGEENWDN